MPALPRRVSVACAALACLALAGCDAAEDDSPFFQLQGVWERTDAGFTNRSVQFGPDQSYVFREDDAPVERGFYAVLGGTPGASTFTVRYTASPSAQARSAGPTDEEVRPDETAQLTGDTLVLTPPTGASRTYRRD